MVRACSLTSHVRATQYMNRRCAVAGSVNSIFRRILGGGIDSSDRNIYGLMPCYLLVAHHPTRPSEPASNATC